MDVEHGALILEHKRAGGWERVGKGTCATFSARLIVGHRTFSNVFC
jgi:hypothetical protein